MPISPTDALPPFTMDDFSRYVNDDLETRIDRFLHGLYRDLPLRVPLPHPFQLTEKLFGEISRAYADVGWRLEATVNGELVFIDAAAQISPDLIRMVHGDLPKWLQEPPSESVDLPLPN